MIDCADSTMLRTHLDHPDAALDAHLDGCRTCTGLLHSVAEDAGYARRTLALLDPANDAGPIGVGPNDVGPNDLGPNDLGPNDLGPNDVGPIGVGPNDVDRLDIDRLDIDRLDIDRLDIDRPDIDRLDVEAALAAVLAAAGPASVVPLTGSRRRPGWAGRRAVLTAAAAVVVLAVAVTPAGRDAVAATLDAFRGERLRAVSVDLDDWATSPGSDGFRALEALGDVDVTDLTEPVEAADVAEAAEITGIEAPSLPDAPDRLVALAPGTVRVVLEARNGNGVPADLDGAALVVEVPGAIGAIYGPADGPPETVIGRSGPLVVRAEGASLEAIRSFLLSRDELPADLRTQLADIDDWRSTIPVPVPLDGPGWKDVEVGGRPAIAFGDDSGIGALVLRQDTDGVTVVGGRIKVSRALELAAEA